MNLKNKTEYKMIEHVVNEWNRDDVYIVLPRDTQPLQKWFEVKQSDLDITKRMGNIFKREWHVKVHGIFNLHVVYHASDNSFDIFQIDFDGENVRDNADSLK